MSAESDRAPTAGGLPLPLEATVAVTRQTTNGNGPDPLGSTDGSEGRLLNTANANGNGRLPVSEAAPEGWKLTDSNGSGTLAPLHLNGDGAHISDAANGSGMAVPDDEVSEAQAAPDAVSVSDPPDIHAIDILCGQFHSICASAVDALEISSALEFEGISDQAARQRYGALNVFALAEELYRRVPRDPAEPAPAPDPWAAHRLRPAVHGVLYGLPAVCFPAAAGLLTGTGVLSMLVVALLTSWASSQALAYLGYLQLGRGNADHARRLLRAGLLGGLVLMVLAMAVLSEVIHVRPSALLFGVGLGAYMLGATVLLVLGEEWLVVIVLAPGVLASTAYLLLSRPPRLELAVWGALAATPFLALVLALFRTTWTADRMTAAHHLGSGPRGRLFALADLRNALPSAGFGLVAASLLVFPVVTGVHGHGGVNTGALLASLPLALSMGAAEWRLIWYRRRIQRVLARTGQLGEFAERASGVLLVELLQYLIVLVMLAAAVVAVAIRAKLVEVDSAAIIQIAAYIALGGAMFVSLLLQAFGSRIFPLVCCAIALGAEIFFRGRWDLGQIVVCVDLLLTLFGYSIIALGNVVRYT
jgi:hypothetical protein